MRRRHCVSGIARRVQQLPAGMRTPRRNVLGKEGFVSASNLPAGPALLLALLLLGACNYETTRSGTLTERGRVAMTIYTPATHGSGTGFSSGGHLVFTDVNIEP